MSIVLLPSYVSSATVAQGATSYAPVGMNGLRWSTVDDGRNKPVYRTAGTLSGLWCRVTVNTLSAGGSVKTRINTSDGNQVITIPASTTGTFSTSGSDSVSAGDTVSYKAIGNAGSGSMTTSVVAVMFNASGTTSSVRTGLSANGATSGTASTTIYGPITAGQSSTNVTEANTQFKMKTAATMNFMNLFVTSNARTTSSDVKSRVNGADGNLLVTIPGSTTGLFEDTTHSDTLAVGDLISVSITTGTGSGATTIAFYSVSIETTNLSFHLMTGQSFATANAYLAGVTSYDAVCGSGLTQATEATAQVRIGTRVDVTSMECYVHANTILATSTMTLRKNGADATNVISIPTITTGYFEDTTPHIDTFEAGQMINYKVVVGAGGTSLLLQIAGVLATLNPSKVDAIFFAGD